VPSIAVVPRELGPGRCRAWPWPPPRRGPSSSMAAHVGFKPMAKRASSLRVSPRLYPARNPRLTPSSFGTGEELLYACLSRRVAKVHASTVRSRQGVVIARTSRSAGPLLVTDGPHLAGMRPAEPHSPGPPTSCAGTPGAGSLAPADVDRDTLTNPSGEIWHGVGRVNFLPRRSSCPTSTPLTRQPRRPQVRVCRPYLPQRPRGQAAGSPTAGPVPRLLRIARKICICDCEKSSRWIASNPASFERTADPVGRQSGSGLCGSLIDRTGPGESHRRRRGRQPEQGPEKPR
jgi:hypothetical protein